MLIPLRNDPISGFFKYDFDVLTSIQAFQNTFRQFVFHPRFEFHDDSFSGSIVLERNFANMSNVSDTERLEYIENLLFVDLNINAGDT